MFKWRNEWLSLNALSKSYGLRQELVELFLLIHTLWIIRVCLH
ncbi:MAG: hypothetical protein JWN98_306 [Abditibacteriota bacterium]|nr:hypothetical protein [Abditibacteriota bacterium]